ncbi:Hypothetical predicted protein [Pelobates cultripes]|uniref:Interleukin-5 n=1 Tax=Pelobates cultripes TaxID=61616 RepID=A0AAD1RRW1_PELCU|nr:Hypothetical predicted protein [Pelobates cultripes]
MNDKRINMFVLLGAYSVFLIQNVNAVHLETNQDDIIKAIEIVNKLINEQLNVAQWFTVPQVIKGAEYEKKVFEREVTNLFHFVNDNNQRNQIDKLIKLINKVNATNTHTTNHDVTFEKISCFLDRLKDFLEILCKTIKCIL